MGSQIRSATFAGPVPPPDLLGNYEAICPGSADRIFRMAEAQAEHRREMERAIVIGQIEHSKKQFAEARCGQICALLITLTAICVGSYTALQGHEWAGGAIGVGGIGGIVTTFILGREKKQEKQQPASQPNQKPNKSGRKSDVR